MKEGELNDMDIAESAVEAVWTVSDVQIVVSSLQLLSCFALLFFIIVIVKALIRLLNIFF